jgi:hypothetical protein
VEPGWVLLDVSFDGKEVLQDEIGSCRIIVGLGIQPSAGWSSRSRIEIQENRTDCSAAAAKA